MKRQRSLTLPLLGKELLDLSARLRTYLVRMLYAAVLMLISFVALNRAMPPGSTVRSILGCGLHVMDAIGFAQQIGLALVLPALCCGVFTMEKERNTLGLLFLTKLGPWTILFEKLLSRLLLAWSFVIISAPAMAFCYGLGGITIDLLLAQILKLLVSSLTIVTISILCSTYFRSTTSALMASYFLTFGSRIVLQAGIYTRLMNGRVIRPDELLRSVMLQGGISLEDAPFVSGTFSPLYGVVLLSIPWLLTSLVCLWLARRYLVSRAFLVPTNRLRAILVWLDWMYERANRNPLTRGIVVLRPTHRMPGFDPVAWRETTTRSLGQLRYLFRIMLMIELPTLVVIIAGMQNVYDRQMGMVPELQACLWIGLILTSGVLSAGLIAGERSRATLDVLLTTPIPAQNIVSQKIAGVTRLILVCQIPIWTCLFFRVGANGDFRYFSLQASMLLVYPWLAAWIGMSHGLRSKTTMAAVIKSLLDIAARCAIPYILFSQELAKFWDGAAYGASRQLFSILSLISPMTLMIVAEEPLSQSSNDWIYNVAYNTPVAILLNTAFHFWALTWIRLKCLDRADRLLGREIVKWDQEDE